MAEIMDKSALSAAVDTELLRRLCDARGVSGREEEIAALIREIAAPFADELSTDRSGNVIALRRGRSDRRCVLVTAHMDEVGYYVAGITDEGLLQLDAVGGVDPRVVFGKRVLIGEARIPGAIGAKPVHQRTPEERKKAVPLDKLCVDIGAADRAEAEASVTPGDDVIFDSDFVLFGGGRVKARALDNRVGCLASLFALREAPAFDTFFAFTVQEEIGLRGAIPAAFSTAPDVCFNLDTTTAADFPPTPVHRTSCRSGGGVAIYQLDSRTYHKPAWVAAAVAAANACGIPWQYKNAVTGGTDAGSVHISRAGVPTVTFSAPVRLLHSPAGSAALSDIGAECLLAAALVRGADEFFQAIAPGR